MIWILAGLLLLVSELLLPGAYLLWIGLAAAGTGLVVLGLDPSFGVTVTIFLLLLAASIAVAVRRHRRRPASTLNTPASGLAGRSGILLPPDAGRPRVRVGDSDWPARLSGHGPMPPPGTPVRVQAVDGLVLVVRPEEAG
ncbi:NfeD family protein [Roseomonas sp. OT10]|uniref:NfeD family protein n=1 Tax=Roseomonas cutis TaxID=2897332 RepID=UPI001E374340|nr:NfeD family protein [Roseomonas sp. OT10]UFN48671.1 NfeD family protein [Roseomonas sp. OT10]